MSDSDSSDTKEAKAPKDGSPGVIAEAILKFLGKVPHSDLGQSESPVATAKSITHAAALEAAGTASLLSLPVGPLGWATVIPEMLRVWKIQSKMVADIAAVFGKSGEISREQMLYCLFRHAAAQATRDLVVRVGERYLVRQASVKTMQQVVNKIGVSVTRRVLRKSLVRWIPVAGALGVGGYAYFDTKRVARTALEVFGKDNGLPEPAGEGDEREGPPPLG